MPIYREIPSAVFDSRRVLVADKRPSFHCFGWQTPNFSGWWFGTFFICPYSGNSNPN